MKLFKLFFLLLSLQLLAQNSLTSNGSKSVYYYDSEFKQTDSINASYYKEAVLGSNFKPSSSINLYKFDGTLVSKTYSSYFEQTFGEKDSIIKNGPQTIYHVNGFKEKISFFINDSKIGDEYYYDDNGVLLLESTFSNNILSGPQKGYYKTGEVKFIRNYVKGKIEGDEIGYLKTGEIKYTRKFKNGLLNGNDIGYYRNGKQLYYRTYKFGAIVGEELGYDKDGNQIYIKYYDSSIVEQSNQNILIEKVPNSLRKISFFYNTGELKQVVNYLNGKTNGRSIGFYKSGNKSYIFNYNNGVLQGLSESYFENGELKSTCYFKDGKKNGQEIIYIQEKKYAESSTYYIEYKTVERTYKNGFLHGLEIGFYPSSRIKYTQNWKENILDGVKEIYYSFLEKDIVKEKYFFNNGVIDGEFLNFYQTGEIESKAYYDNGIKDSKIIRYYKSGKIKFIEYYAGNLKQGEWIENYESGKIKAQYSYQSDNLKGEFFKYDENNSEVIYSVNYINNLKHGMEEHFYSSCEPKKQVKFLDGKKNGEEIEYYETGEIKSTQLYENGQPVGPKLIRYKSGNIKEKIENYGEPYEKITTGFYDSSEKETKYIKSYIVISNIFKESTKEYYKNGNLKSQIIPFATERKNTSGENNIRYGEKTIEYYDNPNKIKKYERIDKSKYGIGYGLSLTNDTIFKVEYFSLSEFPLKPNGEYKVEPILLRKNKTLFYPSKNIKTLIENDIYGNGSETGFYDNENKKYVVEIKDHERNGLMQFYKEDGNTKDYSSKYLDGIRVDRKTALVIGNSDYKYMDSLSNPINDVKLIAESLRKLDFKVIERYNTFNDDELWDAIYSLQKHIKNSEINLIYYAGHGISAKGKNYLIPTGLNPVVDDPDEDPYRNVKRNAISLNQLQDELEFSANSRGRSNIIILDACRNNPIIKLRGEKGGLSKVTTPRGTLFAFSTKYGAVAADGRGKNSDYARILAAKILEKNISISSVFKKVRAEFETLGIDQIPTVEDELTADIFLNRKE